MTFLAILGLVLSIAAAVAAFWIGVVAFIVAVDDEDDAFSWGAWAGISVVFWALVALSIWQPLHWAGIA
jgi:hypothetical protein